MTMKRLTDKELNEYHESAIKHRDKAIVERYGDWKGAYASISVAETNLVLIELIMRQG